MPEPDNVWYIHILLAGGQLLAVGVWDQFNCISFHFVYYYFMVRRFFSSTTVFHPLLGGTISRESRSASSAL